MRTHVPGLALRAVAHSEPGKWGQTTSDGLQCVTACPLRATRGRACGACPAVFALATIEALDLAGIVALVGPRRQRDGDTGAICYQR